MRSSGMEHVDRRRLPCDPSRRRSSGCGAPGGRCRVKGVSGSVRWTDPALNGRSPGLTHGVPEGGGDGFGKALESVHDGDQDILNPTVCIARARAKIGMQTLACNMRRLVQLRRLTPAALKSGCAVGNTTLQTRAAATLGAPQRRRLTACSLHAATSFPSEPESSRIRGAL